MRLVAAVAILVASLLAGCADVPRAELSLQVVGAVVEVGDCTFGARDNASDAEWCHVLDVVVTNRGRAMADLASDRWRASGDDHAVYTLPRVEGQTQVSGDDRVEATLRFSASDAVRLVVLHYDDPTRGVFAEATLRGY